MFCFFPLRVKLFIGRQQKIFVSVILSVRQDNPLPSSIGGNLGLGPGFAEGVLSAEDFSPFSRVVFGTKRTNNNKTFGRRANWHRFLIIYMQAYSLQTTNRSIPS